VEHAEKTPDEVHAKVIRISRISGNGADLIKTFYTARASTKSWRTRRAVFTIGADKLNSDLDVRAKPTIRAAGARGIIFGRNIF